MKKLIILLCMFISNFSFAQEFVDFSPGAINIIAPEMDGKKFHCFLGKDKWSLLENFNLGDSAFIEIKDNYGKLDVVLQSPDNPKPHSLNIRRISANGATFDASLTEDGYLVVMSKDDAIFLEKFSSTYQTEFIGFCNQIEKIPSESDIVRIGYIFRMHDYCNETRKCL